VEGIWSAAELRRLSSPPAISQSRWDSTGPGGHDPESNEPETRRPEGLTTREGLNLAGRHDPRWSCPGALKPTGRTPGSDHRGREEVLFRPQGLPGTAVRGLAVTVVWEAGEQTPPPTRLVLVVMFHKGHQCMGCPLLNSSLPFGEEMCRQPLFSFS
jgi:hypothetical protein